MIGKVYRYCRQDMGIKKAIGIFCLLSLMFFAVAVYPQSNVGYDYLIDIGKDYFEKGQYEEALHYFQLAQLVNPASEEALYYINLIKRGAEGRVIADEVVENFQKEILIKKKTKALEEMKKERRRKERIIQEILDDLERGVEKIEHRTDEKPPAPVSVSREQEEESKTTQIPRRVAKERKEQMPAPRVEIVGVKEKKKDKEIERVFSKEVKERDKYLLSATDGHVSIPVEVFLKESFVIQSQVSIKRFLAVTPDKIDVEKIDGASLKVTGKNFGSTFLHVWGDEGRRTFHVAVTFPRVYVQPEKKWRDFEGFKVNYSSNWRQYYEGSRFATLERESLGFNQSVKISGPTPYGGLSGAMRWMRLGKNQEISGYNAALSNGHWLGFDDFNVRVFDISAFLSPLTLGGKSMHGVMFDSPAFNNKLTYTFLYGKEKPAYYGFVSPGAYTDVDSHIEGIRVGFNPDNKNSFYLNFARGYGSDRQEYLRDKVFSLQSSHRVNSGLLLSSEIASDEDRIAGNLSSFWRLSKLNLRLSLYDIEKDFATIVGMPSNRGKIGSNVSIGWQPAQKFSLNSGLNVYKDRLLFNPGRRDELNYEWNGSANYTLDDSSSISNYMYYMNTPGVSSPQRSLNASSTYNKRFNLSFWDDKPLSTYLGYNYQRSKNPLSPSSDYQSNGISSGLSLSWTDYLSYFIRHSYSRVEELQSSDIGNTQIRETGFNFSRAFSPKVSSNFRVAYRDEVKSGERHSFLAGEDSVEGSLGFSFAPDNDTKFFIDGRIRNVWPDSAAAGNFMEADFRLGTSMTWDSFFKWAPKTTIAGVVFKDANSNGVRDEGEEGIKGVKVIIGPREAVSDEKGYFKTVVQVKSLVATIDFATIPDKHILTTASSLKIDTSRGGSENISFGLSTQAGVYGVVFYDANDNSKLDKEDFPIMGARMVLDNKKTATTNNKGIYFFSDIVTGKHSVKIDVNSLPLEYLPKISIMKDIEVEEGVTYSHHIPLRKRVDK